MVVVGGYHCCIVLQTCLFHVFIWVASCGGLLLYQWSCSDVLGEDHEGPRHCQYLRHRTRSTNGPSDGPVLRWSHHWIGFISAENVDYENDGAMGGYRPECEIVAAPEYVLVHHHHHWIWTFSCISSSVCFDDLLHEIKGGALQNGLTAFIKGFELR